VLDLKPYVPAFDHVPAERIGWFAERAGDVHLMRADAFLSLRAAFSGNSYARLGGRE
jgi:hypothetical protein